MTVSPPLAEPRPPAVTGGVCLLLQVLLLLPSLRFRVPLFTTQGAVVLAPLESWTPAADDRASFANASAAANRAGNVADIPAPPAEHLGTPSSSLASLRRCCCCCCCSLPGAVADASVVASAASLSGLGRRSLRARFDGREPASPETEKDGKTAASVETPAWASSTGRGVVAGSGGGVKRKPRQKVASDARAAPPRSSALAKSSTKRSAARSRRRDRGVDGRNRELAPSHVCLGGGTGLGLAKRRKRGWPTWQT